MDPELDRASSCGSVEQHEDNQQFVDCDGQSACSCSDLSEGLEEDDAADSTDGLEDCGPANSPAWDALRSQFTSLIRTLNWKKVFDSLLERNLVEPDDFSVIMAASGDSSQRREFLFLAGRKGDDVCRSVLELIQQDKRHRFRSSSKEQSSEEAVVSTATLTSQSVTRIMNSGDDPNTHSLTGCELASHSNKAPELLHQHEEARPYVLQAGKAERLKAERLKAERLKGERLAVSVQNQDLQRLSETVLRPTGDQIDSPINEMTCCYPNERLVAPIEESQSKEQFRGGCGQFAAPQLSPVSAKQRSFSQSAKTVDQCTCVIAPVLTAQKMVQATIFPDEITYSSDMEKTLAYVVEGHHASCQVFDKQETWTLQFRLLHRSSRGSECKLHSQEKPISVQADALTPNVLGVRRVPVSAGRLGQGSHVVMVRPRCESSVHQDKLLLSSLPEKRLLVTMAVH